METTMRQLWMALCVAALAFLPACAAYQTEASPPTVSFNYADDDDYDEAAERADDHCRDNYGLNANLLDRDRDGGGYRATFSCE